MEHTDEVFIIGSIIDKAEFPIGVALSLNGRNGLFEKPKIGLIDGHQYAQERRIWYVPEQT
ncbi:hypothetical protein TRIP_B200197 [uncultured Desulfatiglans sp.]|nr:hypothetical protein TRIP_B200197 [uncultured Desulfatiglans sp.]